MLALTYALTMSFLSGTIAVLLLFQSSHAIDFASLAVSNTSQAPSTWDNYCVVYNSKFTSLSSSKNPPSGSFKMATNEIDPFGCSDLPQNSYKDTTLIVERGNCTYYRKAFVAQSAKASLLVVIYNESLVDSMPDLQGGTPDAVDITVPVLLIDNETGAEIMERLNSMPLYTSAYVPSSVPLDPSAAVIFAIAVTTVLLASYIANNPYEFLRYGLLIRKGSDCTSLPQQEDEKVNKAVIITTVVGVIIMVLVACTALILLYEFYYPMVYIAIALYTIAATVGLYNFLSPFVALLPMSKKLRLPKNKIPILKYRPDPLFFLTVLFCIAVVVWWAVERHASYAWILQDAIGFTFILWLVKRLSFFKPWVVALLMVILFFYDIFMVFITPYFTSDGVSVMEKAATGPQGAASSQGGGGHPSEILPVVFTVPRFIYPSKLQCICSDYDFGRPYSLLGYGDVGIPGILVTLCLKFDFTVRSKKCFRLYYATSGIAYIVGLIATFVALALMKSAQPALLYLVPSTLGSIVILSLIRKEFTLFFTGKPPRSKTPATSSTEGNSVSSEAETENDHIENDHNIIENEKQALINQKTP